MAARTAPPMPIQQETRRYGWAALIAAWLVAGAFVFLHTTVVRDYIALLNAQALRGAAVPTTPLRQVIPARHADAQMWVRHVLDGEPAGGRVRFTKVDNAPAGREVHWSSAFGWLLRAAAALQERFGGTTGGTMAIERTLLWFNAPLFLAVIVGWSAWVARRSGTLAGVMSVIAMVGHARFREGFEPTYVDHHGLATAAVLGLLLGAVYMGFGWWRLPAERATAWLPASVASARRAAVVSAVSGAIGLWLSAASMLPVIALVGVGGLLAAVGCGPRALAAGARFEPRVWRCWGRTGAVASAVCYLAEYAPGHLGWRLEVNHPLYAVAWWGAAELIALIGSAGADREPAWAGLRNWRLIPVLLAVVAPLAVILLGGRAVFLPGDPFVAELRHLVAESRSLPATAREYGLGSVTYDLTSALLLLAAVAFLVRRGEPDVRLVLGALGFIFAAYLVAAFLVVRWWVIGSAIQITLLLWLVAATRSPVGRRWAVAVAAVVLLVPAAWRIARDYRANTRRIVAAVDLFQPLYRDLAAALRASQPNGAINVLSSPNVSAGVSYFGRFESIGTLFWENAAGLRAAAEIYASDTDDEALRRIRERNVTHIVLLSAEPFVREYLALLHPERPPPDVRRTLVHRLMSQPSAGPRWLRMIPYRAPAELAAVGGTISIFKVVPEQKDDERLFHTAVALAARGDTAAADEAFLAALAVVPTRAQASLCAFAGETLYEHGAHALAVKMLRRARHDASNPDVANLTAWILATSADPAVRDGVAALALVLPLAQRSPADPVLASTLAAAYAETGRFDDAVRAADSALSAVRAAGGDRESEALLARRLESYRVRQPWRQ